MEQGKGKRTLKECPPKNERAMSEFKLSSRASEAPEAH
jgi:hypothetical protein